ncbi:hypothetical protein D3C72_1665970 [compost metagenome]
MDRRLLLARLLKTLLQALCFAFFIALLVALMATFAQTGVIALLMRLHLQLRQHLRTLLFFAQLWRLFVWLFREGRGQRGHKLRHRRGQIVRSPALPRQLLRHTHRLRCQSPSRQFRPDDER